MDVGSSRGLRFHVDEKRTVASLKSSPIVAEVAENSILFPGDNVTFIHIQKGTCIRSAFDGFPAVVDSCKKFFAGHFPELHLRVPSHLSFFLVYDPLESPLGQGVELPAKIVRPPFQVKGSFLVNTND